MNVLALCCTQEGNIQEDLLYPADRAIVSALKKIDGISVTAETYEEKMMSQLKKEQFVIVFNLCDAFPEAKMEAEVVGQLERKHIPFTGNGEKALSLCSDKVAVRELLSKERIPIPAFFLVHAPDKPLPECIPFPVIIKPANEHASVGIDEDAVVFDLEKLQKKLVKVFDERKGPIIVEQYIEGREYCIPIIGNSHPTVLPLLEIDYSEHFDNKPKILSYKAKWSKNSHAFKDTYSRTAKLPEEFRSRLEQVGKKVYTSIGMRGYGTVDVRVDSFGNIYVIDVNTNSYIAPESDMAKAAAHIGIAYPDLLKKIIDYGLAEE